MYPFDFVTSAHKLPAENSFLKNSVDTSQAIASMECSKVLNYGSIIWVVGWYEMCWSCDKPA